MQYKTCSTILRSILQFLYLDLPTFCASLALLRATILVPPLQEFLVHCRLELFFSSDFRFDRRCFHLCGRLKRVLFAFSEKGVCRQYRPSPLCISCIYQLLASMALLIQESSTLLYGLRCFPSNSFKMCSLSDVADDL